MIRVNEKDGWFTEYKTKHVINKTILRIIEQRNWLGQAINALLRFGKAKTIRKVHHTRTIT